MEWTPPKKQEATHWDPTHFSLPEWMGHKKVQPVIYRLSMEGVSKPGCLKALNQSGASGYHE